MYYFLYARTTELIGTFLMTMSLFFCGVLTLSELRFSFTRTSQTDLWYGLQLDDSIII